MKHFTNWIETKSSGISLWLDDERDPDDPFIQEEFHARSGMTWVKSAKAAIRILDGGEVTYMSFDHDLGPAEAGTGYEVAQWVEREAHAGTLPRFIWTVHSFNPVGSRNIIRAMTSAERYWRQHEESEHKGQ